MMLKSSLPVLLLLDIHELHKSLPKAYKDVVNQCDLFDLVTDNFFFRELDDLLIIYTRRIKFISHTPQADWYPEIVLPLESSNTEVMKKVKSLLLKKSLFNICLECHRLMEAAHIDENVCHSCWSSNHGHVY